MTTYAPEEVPVFFNFVDLAIDSGFHKLSGKEDFTNLASLIYNFAKEGLFAFEQDGLRKGKPKMSVTDGHRLYATFMLALKHQVMLAMKATSKEQ